MSNYVEYNDMIAFHPGYYVKELIDESGLTQEDFAKRLDTTPKNLSLLVRGEQNLSIDIAMKLSRMMGTSVNYWLNLQNAYDTLVAEFKSKKELVEERRVFEDLDYAYFRNHFGLPDLPRKIDEQIRQVREFLNVATLSVLTKRDMSVNFRSSTEELTRSNTVKANAMIQIAVNKVLKTNAPKFEKAKFEKAVKYALTLTRNHGDFYPHIYDAFREAGVIFIILPNLSGSKINGATKRVGHNVMLMVNDRRLNADSFWFTLFHEIGHIMNGDYGISFERETGEQEEAADRYAEDSLIPPEKYQDFLDKHKYDIQSIRLFADQIERDPGIVLGRLQNDKKVEFDDWTMKPLRHKYKIQMVI
ncbi:MAG: HigA family addiction module antitoxin [Eubacterium sp.]|nr:HigA family addiction module antitoxin [Eubacterium sp.]MCM1216691.1 HigA family addiction module antitoxin [Lachnospiraceae bacterium]MCM1240385.1 HigA family addiction module antitoxin [Lachnospiraceae bacterium]